MFALRFIETTFFTNVLIVFFTHGFCIGYAHEERHLCYYRINVMTPADVFVPKFSAVGVCDDRKFSNYSSMEDWMSDSSYVAKPYLKKPYDPKGKYEDELKSLSNCSSLCSGLRVFQRIIGCEIQKLPDGSVKSLTAFDKYGFDGEDFLAFDFDTMQWIKKSEFAKETKLKWDHQTRRNHEIKRYLNACMSWISTFNYTNKNAPDVRVFASEASDDKINLTCHVTSFYPKDIEVYIRLDETILEDQTSSGVRPNADETFQMRNRVTIDRNHGGLYDCVVIHSSLTEPMVVSFKRGGSFPWIAVGVSIAVVVSVLVIVYIIYKKRQSTGPIRKYSGYGATELNHLTSPASS